MNVPIFTYFKAKLYSPNVSLNLFSSCSVLVSSQCNNSAAMKEGIDDVNWAIPDPARVAVRTDGAQEDCSPEHQVPNHSVDTWLCFCLHWKLATAYSNSPGIPNRGCWAEQTLSWLAEASLLMKHDGLGLQSHSTTHLLRSHPFNLWLTPLQGTRPWGCDQDGV